MSESLDRQSLVQANSIKSSWNGTGNVVDQEARSNNENNMSAAAARRKKQLAACAAASDVVEKDVVIEQLDTLLNEGGDDLSEETTY